MAISALGTSGIPPSAQSEAQHILQVLWNYYSNKFLKLIFTSCLLSCGRDNLCSRKVTHESAASSANVPVWSKIQLSLQNELEKLHFCSLWCFASSFLPAFFRKGGINPTNTQPASSLPAVAPLLNHFGNLQPISTPLEAMLQFAKSSSCVCRMPGRGTVTSLLEMLSILLDPCFMGNLLHLSSPEMWPGLFQRLQ